MHQQVQIEFFSLFLPGLTVTKVLGINRSQPPHCAWEVFGKLKHQLDKTEHVYDIAFRNKLKNVEIDKINFFDFCNFSIIYNVTCQCKVKIINDKSVVLWL